MPSDDFAARMAELDALVDLCRGQSPFTTGIVRDRSNRTNRDWPWWGVEIEQTRVDGPEKRRVTASVELRSTLAGKPGAFEAKWLARIWSGVSEDSFRERGELPLDWDEASAARLKDTMTILLTEANAAIARAIDDRGPH